jgi:uncharacterized protein YcaQ
VPDQAEQPIPTAQELEDYRIRRALQSLGLLPAKGTFWWWRTRPQKAALQRAIDEGLVTPVALEGHEDEAWYAWTEALEALAGLPDPLETLILLSPFDSAIIRRRHVEYLFGFDYRLECYLPKAKRHYGYFALPILYGDRFIGRVDVKADRATSTLVVRQLTLEDGIPRSSEGLPLLIERLWAFATFNECDRLAIESVTPTDLRPALLDLAVEREYAAG